MRTANYTNQFQPLFLFAWFAWFAVKKILTESWKSVEKHACQ